MPLVDLAGQANGASTGSAAAQLTLTLAGQGNALADGPSKLAVTLDLRNHPRPGHFLTALAQATSSATGTLTQLPSPLGGNVALKGSAHGRAGAQAPLSASLTLIGRADGKSVTPTVRLTGLLTLQARSTGQSSNYARLLRDRLLAAQAAGQASGTANLA